MEQVEAKYKRIYKQNIIDETMPFQNTFTFGWISFMLIIASLFVMVFAGIWQHTVPELWERILSIFFLIFLPGTILMIYIRLFPSDNAGVVSNPKRSETSSILLQVSVCLLAGILNFLLLSVAFQQTLFEGDLQMKIYVICNATWEEIFFCGSQIAVMRFMAGTSGKILGVGIRMLFFAVFHIVAYAQVAQALLGMLFMGLIYGIALVVWKRIDVSMGVHLMLNLVAS